MKLFRLFALVIWSFVILFSCSQKKNFDIEYYPNGSVKKIATFQSENIKQTVDFDANGNCKKISHFTGTIKDGQNLVFFNGRLVEMANFKMGKINSSYYQFYAISGALKNFSYLKEGIEQGMSMEYYDLDEPFVKFSFHHDTVGRIYYKESYDSVGRLIEKQGVR